MRHALVDLKAAKVVNVVEIVTGDGSKANTGFAHVASETANIGDGWNGAAIVSAAPPPAPPRTWEQQQASAKAALSDTDLVATRCFKSGIDFPADWQDYCGALRDIVRAEIGDPTAPLPTVPVTPEGME